MSERFVVAREGCDLAGERWPGGAPLLVLLHEGVADRRGWHQVAGSASCRGQDPGPIRKTAPGATVDALSDSHR